MVLFLSCLLLWLVDTLKNFWLTHWLVPLLTCWPLIGQYFPKLPAHSLIGSFAYLLASDWPIFSETSSWLSDWFLCLLAGFSDWLISLECSRSCWDSIKAAENSIFLHKKFLNDNSQNCNHYNINTNISQHQYKYLSLVICFFWLNVVNSISCEHFWRIFYTWNHGQMHF